MLQIETKTYASDALEDAMRLAQTKALNSYSFSDCINTLNYVWADMYKRLALVDEGFYSKTVRLTQRLTKLPPCMKNSITVYAAQDPVGYNRLVFRSSGQADMQSAATYHISGWDLYCPDAERGRNVWLNYIPEQPQLFFTRNNRDPKIYETYNRVQNLDFFLYRLVQTGNQYVMQFKNRSEAENDVDITETLQQFVGSGWQIVYITCDFPYVFVSYKHTYSGEYWSGFYPDILKNTEFIEYNPFAFTGKNSNVEYLDAHYNDKTGMGVVVIDHNDKNRIKEMGWTPDTLLTYPCPEMYRLLVARLAEKFALFNESTVMGVQSELTDATYAFEAFVGKDKSSWGRINNVNPANWGDWL